jgi:hypothetical protein
MHSEASSHRLRPMVVLSAQFSPGCHGNNETTVKTAKKQRAISLFFDRPAVDGPAFLRAGRALSLIILRKNSKNSSARVVAEEGVE